MFNNFGCTSPLTKPNNSFQHRPTAINVTCDKIEPPSYDILGVSPVKREARYIYHHSKSMGPSKNKLPSQ
jgi:hypothetical protein